MFAKHKKNKRVKIKAKKLLTLYPSTGFIMDIGGEQMEGLTRGELAKNAGVNIETIRYYERLGLIPEPLRTKSGYRVFSPEMVRRIRFIKRSQDLGFTLSEINQLLTMTESGGNGCREVREFASHKIKEIELKIRDLQNIKNVLQDLSSKCSDERPIDDCPIIESLQE